MSSTTVSAKIPKELKEKLRQRGVRVSPVVRRALEEELLRLEEQELRQKLKEVRRALAGRVSTDDVVAAVRASREER